MFQLNNIKNIRIANGFSQEELAEKSGLSLRTIQRIEKKETIPHGNSLQKLAAAFEISIDDLIVTEKQNDDNSIILLNLSQLSFLIFPLFGIFIPLIIWINKKNKFPNLEFVRNSILNFQISWNILLFIIFIYKIITIDPSMPITFNTIFLIIILYLYNIILIFANIILFKRKKIVHYVPSIKFLG